MRFDRMDADEKAGSNIFIGITGSYFAENLPFPRGDQNGVFF